MIKYNKDWQPDYYDFTTKFDERFEIDRVFTYVDNKRKHRIRFVKHPNLPKFTVNVFYQSMLKDVISDEKTMTYNINPQIERKNSKGFFLNIFS